MDLTVIIPWRPAADRDTSFMWVFNRYLTFDGGVKINLADSGDEPFSRSASKNKGLDQAGTDIVLFADADMVVDLEWIEQSYRLLASGERAWCVPKRCNLLLEPASKQVRGMDPWDREMPDFGPADLEWSGVTSVGGLVMVSKEGALEAGGYDERFLGWGWEDAAFAMALTHLWGPMHKTHQGWHLWHTKDRTWDSPHQQEVTRLFRRYEQATTPEQMKQIVAEPGRNGL